LWSSLPNLGLNIRLIQCERLLEHTSEFANLLLECLLVAPCQRWVQQVPWNTLEGNRDLQAERAKRLKLGLGKFSRVNGVDDAAGNIQRAPLSSSKLATGPSSVDQPAVNLVLGHALSKHLGVATRVENDERRAVASRESGDRLQNTIFSTRGLRGITGQEMVGSLLGGELADGREDTKGIAGQHDDVRGLAVDDARNLSIGDILDGVCASCVLGNADIVVIGRAVIGVVDDVLEDGAVADSIEDIRLLFSGEVDALGVATTFDVEYTGVRPDVLIVADKQTLGIRRQRGLAGARETEEESDVAVLDANIGGRVKGKLAELDWLEIVLAGGSVRGQRKGRGAAHHNGEDSLLHFSGILCAENDHFHALEVDLNRGGRAHALGEAIGGELTSIVDDEVGLAKVGKLFISGADKHVVL